MVSAADERQRRRTLDYSPSFHFRQLLRQKWQKADAAQTIKLEAEPLIVAEKESSVTTATEGGDEQDGKLRGSVAGGMDGWQRAGVGSFWHLRKVGGSTSPPPGGPGKVRICYLEQT